MANKSSFQQILEDYQTKIMERSLKEAEAKLEKAQVELETAKLQREHVQNFVLANAGAGGVLQ
jgi:hypothetical protein